MLDTHIPRCDVVVVVVVVIVVVHSAQYIKYTIYKYTQYTNIYNVQIYIMYIITMCIMILQLVTHLHTTPPFPPLSSPPHPPPPTPPHTGTNVEEQRGYSRPSQLPPATHLPPCHSGGRRQMTHAALAQATAPHVVRVNANGYEPAVVMGMLPMLMVCEKKGEGVGKRKGRGGEGGVGEGKERGGGMQTWCTCCVGVVFHPQMLTRLLHTLHHPLVRVHTHHHHHTHPPSPPGHG